MQKRLLFFLTALLLLSQGIRAWDGSGTQADPYLIQTTDDWKQLSGEVSAGHSFSGQYFQMTADIDAEGVSTGTEQCAFSGTFDGYGHTLTFDRGGAQPDSFEEVDDFCAPFVKLEGATIRNLKVTGSVFSRHMHTAGIASLIDGSPTTTIEDCHVSSLLYASSKLDSDASFGGLIGNVNPTCEVGPVVRNCSFTGRITGWATRSSGMVGYTNKPITFEHCMFDSKEVAYSDGCATFVRMASGVECTFKECYYTMLMGTPQGEAVFCEVLTGDDCKAEIISEPTIHFDGKSYWQNGALVTLTAHDDADFNHWETNGSCYIGDPWTKNGVQEIRDLSRIPSFSYINYMVEPTAERTMDGTKYRYLSRRDYHLYLSDEFCRLRGFEFDSNGDLYKSIGGKKVWVTAVTGWEGGKIPSDGAQIHNDLSGWFKDYTLMACIAPHAFDGCNELKTLYFMEQIAPPMTLSGMEKGLFENAKNLRAVDFLMCDSTKIVAGLRNGGLVDLGINTQQTLVYLPATYGPSDGTNIVAASSGKDGLHAQAFRLTDDNDHLVPYAFDADKVENSRSLPASDIPYTFCVPYKLNVPSYARAYKLSQYDDNTLVFKEVKGELEAMQPYLLKVVGSKRLRKTSTTLDTNIAQTIPASDGSAYGQQVDVPGYSLRGTFEAISNSDAAELGAYILQSDGDWHPVVHTEGSSAPTILPFRAFLLPSARNTSPCLSMTLEDAATDIFDIEAIETIDVDGTHRYYDLNGRELQGKPEKGIYIYKGKKYWSH